MATKTLEPAADTREEPRRGAPAAAARKLSDFGQLGFGMDVITMRPTVPLVDLTYEDDSFDFHQEIRLPDQFNWDKTPVGTVHEGNFSGIMTTAQDYQRTLSARFLGGAPVDGIQFSGEADAANQRFTRQSERTVRMLFEKLASYEFLRIRNIDRERFPQALREDVRRAIADAGTDRAAIHRFFGFYGTHVVSTAGIGGQMHLETRLQVTAEVNEEMTRNDIDVSGEAKAEQGAFVKGTIGFHDRFAKNSAVFIENSSTDYQLLGGEVTAGDVEAWKKSLKESRIPTAGNVSAIHRVSRLGSVGYLRGDGSQYLGLVSPTLDPIYEVLPLSPEQKAAWKEAFRQYFGDVSPFDGDSKRFVVDHVGSAIREGQQAVFTMGGWAETWEDVVALEALPMATALVAVTTNSFADVWDERTIYAGQTTQVRGKTPYTGTRYTIKVLSISGDPGAVVYARARKVAW